MATKTRVTLEQFLAMPETEPPSELIDGEVIQKVAPNIFHARLTSRIISRLDSYLQQSGEGFVVNEARHLQRAEQRVYLPDISAFFARDEDRVMGFGPESPVEVPPAFAIEVLSPGTSSGRTLERIDFFMRIGTELLWVVDPETESVTAYRPDEPARRHAAPEKIDAAPVFPGFELDLGKLFAFLARFRGNAP